jgi:hypothetical protein
VNSSIAAEAKLLFFEKINLKTIIHINYTIITKGMKKIISSGFVAGLVLLIMSFGLSILANFLLPSLATEYESAIFRPWSDPRMWLYFLYPFTLALLLSWVWNETKSLIKATTQYKKGLKFGLIAFFVLSIPGMLITYASFNVSMLMILTWTISGLLDCIISGLIFSRMNK